MVEENESSMKKLVATPYPNKDIRVLKISEIFHLPYCELEVMRVEKKIRFDAINFYPSKCSIWHLEFRKSERYYDYFNKLLQEANL